MREDKKIVQAFEAAMSATWIYGPVAMRKAAIAIKNLTKDTTDIDDVVIMEAYAAILERRAGEKEENYRQTFGG